MPIPCTERAPINYFAYKDEKPVFDFSNLKPGPRVYCYYVSASWIHFRGLEVGIPSAGGTRPGMACGIGRSHRRYPL